MGDGVRAEQLTAALLALALLALGGGVARAEPYLAVRFGAKCATVTPTSTAAASGRRSPPSTPTTSCTTSRSCHCPRGSRASMARSTSGSRSAATCGCAAPRPGRTHPTPRAAYREPCLSRRVPERDPERPGSARLPPGRSLARCPLALRRLQRRWRRGHGARDGGDRAPALQHLFKGGRFFPPFGLRVYEDASFIRSNSGFTFQNPFEGGEAGRPGTVLSRHLGHQRALRRRELRQRASSTKTSSRRERLRRFRGCPDAAQPDRWGLLRAGSRPSATCLRSTAGRTSGSSPIWGNSTSSTTHQLPANTGRDQYASYAEVDWLLFNWLNLRGTFDFLKVVRQPQPDALPDRGRAVHRQVHPAAPLLRHQQRPREPTAAEHDRDHLRAPLLLLDGALYFTDSTTIPFRPPCATFRPSTVIVFAAESMAAA